MDFDEALKILNIEDYKERIFNSNSHGELFHLHDYYLLTRMGDVDWFRDWFKSVVNFAEKNWERPESVFQHIPEFLRNTLAHNQSLHSDGQGQLSE